MDWIGQYLTSVSCSDALRAAFPDTVAPECVVVASVITSFMAPVL